MGMKIICGKTGPEGQDISNKNLVLAKYMEELGFKGNLLPEQCCGLASHLFWKLKMQIAKANPV